MACDANGSFESKHLAGTLDVFGMRRLGSNGVDAMPQKDAQIELTLDISEAVRATARKHEALSIALVPSTLDGRALVPGGEDFSSIEVQLE